MLIAALFAIVKTWKQPNCPLSEEWIRKMWYIYIYVYILNIYMNITQTLINEIMPFAAAWMDLETVILSEVNQTEEEKYHMVSLICGI